MARAVDERVKLLHGPYKAPRLRRGDRAFCLFKDCDVIVTGWTSRTAVRERRRNGVAIVLRRRSYIGAFTS